MVAYLAAYLVLTGRRDALRRVWPGISAVLGKALFAPSRVPTSWPTATRPQLVDRPTDRPTDLLGGGGGEDERAAYGRLAA